MKPKFKIIPVNILITLSLYHSWQTGTIELNSNWSKPYFSIQPIWSIWWWFNLFLVTIENLISSRTGCPLPLPTPHIHHASPVRPPQHTLTKVCSPASVWRSLCWYRASTYMRVCVNIILYTNSTPKIIRKQMAICFCFKSRLSFVVAHTSTTPLSLSPGAATVGI